MNIVGIFAATEEARLERRYRSWCFRADYYVKQGRLEPVQSFLKNNKRGLGADKVKKTAKKPYDTAASNEKNVLDDLPSKKCKTLSKRIRKMQEQEKRLEEKEFERVFYREFWPDNV
ncbi:uncharacterized protein LOC132183583 isoform X3 [Corylus avellana]|uniref:uncharacterized protein LOC132183583 isoform X3 n=1 Tax=Corylus avellana TaxID=13451 RepID=UPI00286B7B43|nr:uncharacterized protein LOC132183583 isoform X3 [Corylus avellana]